MHDKSELRSETLPGQGQGGRRISNTQLPIGLFPRRQGEPVSASASIRRDNHLVVLSIMSGSHKALNEVSAIIATERF